MESKNSHLHQNILPNKHTIARNLSRVIHSVIDVTVDMDRMQDALPGVNAAKLETSLTILKFVVELKIQEQHVKYYMFKT